MYFMHQNFLEKNLDKKVLYRPELFWMIWRSDPTRTQNSSPSVVLPVASHYTD
jgi:hypothetical protein